MQHGSGLNCRGLCIGLIENLTPGFQFRFGEYAELFKHFHRLFLSQGRDRGNHVRQIRQAAARGLLLPLLTVSVAVEQDAAVIAHIFSNQQIDIPFKILALLQHVRRFAESLGYDGADHGIGIRDALRGADHTELKLVAGKGKGRGTVTVGRILVDDRQGGNAGIQTASLDAACGRSVFNDLIHDVTKLIAEENRNNRRRRLVRTEPLVVARAGCGHPQEIRMAIHRLDHTGKHQQKLQIVVGRGARVKQVLAGIAVQRPVVVLAGTVDPRKGLFMQQADQAVPGRHAFHRLHGELVLIHRDIAGAVNRRALMLRGSDLVVLRCGGDAHLPQLRIQIRHELTDAFADDAEVLILQLLSLGRGRAEERPSGIDQVAALEVALPVHYEVFLFRADGEQNPLRLLIPEKPQNPHRLLRQRLHGSQKRRFVVQSLAGVGNEDRRDAQDRSAGHLLDKGGRGHIPRGIASCIMGGAQAAGGEGGGVRLTHDELFAGQIQDDLAHLIRRSQEGIVLFRRDAGQGLEPVRVVGCTFFNGPLHHGLGHHVRGLHGNLTAAFNYALHLGIYLGGQPLLHHRVAEHIHAKIIGHFHLFSPFGRRPFSFTIFQCTQKSGKKQAFS